MSSTLALPNSAQDEATLVLFGRDGAGKPHAAWFDAQTADLAVKAASLTGMRVLHVKGEDQKALAQQLPRGRVFASGKAFASFVRSDLYGRLAEMAGDAAGLKTVKAAALPATKGLQAVADSPAGAPANSKEAAPTVSTPSEPWDAIGIGSVVLASVDVTDGWWESEILGQNGEAYTLKWRDFPGERPFTRRRTQLALLPPSR